MEPPARCPAGGGLWSCARAPHSSKESRERLRLMKEESRLINQQRKQIDQSSKTKAAPPLKSPPRHKTYVSRRRSAESCRAGNSYEREKFCPGPTRDLEKEKRRLQSILSRGEEELADMLTRKAPESSEEKERYEEVLDEIEERRQFLADMAALDQEREYLAIINAEISQKQRELELLRKSRRHNYETSAGKEEERD